MPNKVQCKFKTVIISSLMTVLVPEYHYLNHVWEDKIPSRIDLGKRKYGGPFTTEEVKNVKTFLQLLKLLLSLSGILIASYSLRINLFQTYSHSRSESYNLQVFLTYTILCIIATTGLLILCHTFSCFHKCHLSILKWIGIGAAFTVICALCNLLLNFKYATRINKSDEYISPYVNMVPSYFVSNFLYCAYCITSVNFRLILAIPSLA